MSFKDRVLSGIEWSIASNVGGQAINFIYVIFLSRILSPKEFGQVAMITVFTNFAILFNSVGLGEALIQKKDIDDGHLQAVFWVNLIMGISLTFIIILLSPFFAKFYHEPVLKPLAILTAFNFLILSLKSVQRALLLKSLNFKLIAKIDLSAEFIAGLVAIFCALLGFGPWSLVIRTLILSSVIVIVLWIGSSWRPKFSFQKNKAKELLGFGSNLMGSNIAFYWTKNIDNLLIGKFLGSSLLGIYSRAYGLMLLPVRQITNVIGQVMFPAFSSINEETEKMRNIFKKMLTSIALITFPLMIWLFVIPKYFILVVYGEKWAEVIPIIRILSLLGMTLSINMAFRWILMARGRTDLLFKLTFLEFALVSSGILIGLKNGLSGVAIGIVIGSSIFVTIPYWKISGKLIDFHLKEILIELSKPFFCALLMGIVMYFAQFLIQSKIKNNLIVLTILTILGIGFYLTVIQFMKIDSFKEIKLLIKSRIKRNF